jgi:hypothetical protein
MNTQQKETYDFDENIQIRINTLKDELLKGSELSSKAWLEFVQKSFERIIRQFCIIMSAPNIDMVDIEELEEKKHRAFSILAEISEKEANAVNISSKVLDYTVAANEEIFEKFQNPNFVHAHKKVYQNPENETIKDLLQEDMRNNVKSLLEYRKAQIRVISKPKEELQKAVEKIAKLNTIPELNADLAIREAANDMFFEPATSKPEKHENQYLKTEIQETSLLSRIKARIKRWF